MDPLDVSDLTFVAEYIASVTGRETAALLDELRGELDIGVTSDPHTALVNGLTSLRRSSWDVEALIQEAGPPYPGPRMAHLFALGLLFLFGNKFNDWVAARVRQFYEETERDPTRVLAVGKRLHRLYKPHRVPLKFVRDRVFHTRPWHEDEVVTVLAAGMYATDVPTTLLEGITAFGCGTVTALCQDGVGIPGIGCFNVICR
jgi:hypothetical protein